MRIPVEQQILAVTFSLILLLVTVQLVRKHRLREEYALVWLAASLVIFVLTVFDPLVGFLADLFAVTYAPTLIVVFGVLFCLIILLSQSVLISFQADRIRDLAQTVGLLEWRVQQLQRAGIPFIGASGEQGRSAAEMDLDALALDTQEDAEIAVRNGNNGGHPAQGKAARGRTGQSQPSAKKPSPNDFDDFDDFDDARNTKSDAQAGA